MGQMNENDVIKAIKERDKNMKEQVEEIKEEIKKVMYGKTAVIDESVDTFINDFEILCKNCKTDTKWTDNDKKGLNEKLEKWLKYCFGGNNWKINITFDVRVGLGYLKNHNIKLFKPRRSSFQLKFTEVEGDYLLPQEFFFKRNLAVTIDFPPDNTFNEAYDIFIYPFAQDVTKLSVKHCKDILNSLVYNPFRNAMDEVANIPMWGPINDNILSFLNYENVYRQIMLQFTGKNLFFAAIK